jgi:hypothetical protein
MSLLQMGQSAFLRTCWRTMVPEDEMPLIEVQCHNKVSE